MTTKVANNTGKPHIKEKKQLKQPYTIPIVQRSIVDWKRFTKESKRPVVGE